MNFAVLGGVLVIVAYYLKARRENVQASLQFSQQYKNAAVPGNNPSNQFALSAISSSLQTVATGSFTAANPAALLALPQFGPLGGGCAYGGGDCQFRSFLELAAYNKTGDPRYINPDYSRLTQDQRDYIVSLGFSSLSPADRDAYIHTNLGI
jgi:hypothetical protein